MGGSSPRRFGPYRILEPLARGGMAEVFVAMHDTAERICVLKLLLEEMEEHATAAQRFQREARVASLLRHPNIAGVIDAGRADGKFYMAMEYIAGVDVEAMMRHLVSIGKMLPHRVSLAIILKVLDALEYAHAVPDEHGEALGIVHRDLSPRNVMVSFSGHVHVIDFGLARGRFDDFKTAPGMLLGTLRYTSPEQAMTLPVDLRSDLYTLCVVLHEMLCGRPLVPDGQIKDILRCVVRDVPPRVTEVNPSLPAALDDVLAKGLEKRPDDRYQTALELKTALLAAASDIAHVDPVDLGGFAASLFPDEVADADRRLALSDEPPLELGDYTRTAIVQAMFPDGVISATRTDHFPAFATPNAEAPQRVESIEMGPGLSVGAPASATQVAGARRRWAPAALMVAAGLAAGLTTAYLAQHRETKPLVYAPPPAPQPQPTKPTPRVHPNTPSGPTAVPKTPSDPAAVPLVAPKPLKKPNGRSQARSRKAPREPAEAQRSPDPRPKSPPPRKATPASGAQVARARWSGLERRARGLESPTDPAWVSVLATFRGEASQLTGRRRAEFNTLINSAAATRDAESLLDALRVLKSAAADELP